MPPRTRRLPRIAPGTASRTSADLGAAGGGAPDLPAGIGRGLEQAASRSRRAQRTTTGHRTSTALALLRHAAGGIPALGVHDSIVARASDAEFTEAVMKDVYREVIGFLPVIRRE